MPANEPRCPGDQYQTRAPCVKRRL
jgi:hypothetical protein